MKKLSEKYTNSDSYSSFYFDESRHFEEGITRWNYFPNQKHSASELPSIISTSRFTPEVAEKISKLKNRKGGYDLVEYKSTRYNNVPRFLGLVHPFSYSRIYKCLSVNYNEIISGIESDNSAVKVDQHRDGRVLIMNYEKHEEKIISSIKDSFSKKIRVKTDISNCFGSIYTHSFEWAVRGFEESKKALADRGDAHWSKNLDECLRHARRNETVGLPIGPAASSIAVELILAAVDKKLKDKYLFNRYVDDYTAFFNSHDEAQNFLRELGDELGKYRLQINLNKTHVEELPDPSQEKWVSDIMSAFPLKNNEELDSFTTVEAFSFLDNSVRLNNITPDGSVIKYAVASLVSKINGSVANSVFEYVLNLCWHYPILMPYLEKIDVDEYFDYSSVHEKMKNIVSQHALHRRSDGMCWGIYYLYILQSAIDEEFIDQVIKTEDCVSIAMLSKFENALPKLISYASEILPMSDFGKDRNWFLLYQLFYIDAIKNPYQNDDAKCFEILKELKVDFFKNPEEKSDAEKFCDELSNPFISDEAVEKLNEWLRNMRNGNIAPMEKVDPKSRYPHLFK